MPRTVIPFNNPKLVLADTEAGLTAGDAWECQLTAAQIVGTPSFQAVPQTGCAPAGQVPGRSAWSLNLAWLQDWTAPGGGLSNWALTHETEETWFALSIDTVGFPTVVATGQAYVVAGGFGGPITGAPAAATANWPMLDKPTIVVPADVVTLDTDTELDSDTERAADAATAAA